MKISRTKEEYEMALLEIEKLIDSNRPDGGFTLNFLVDLVKTYEDLHYPIDLPDPVEAAKFRSEQEIK